jgi:hypothetical protein
MTAGAHTPPNLSPSRQSANLTDQTAGPKPAPAKACQPPFTSRPFKPLEPAGSCLGELLRLAHPSMLLSTAVLVKEPQREHPAACLSRKKSGPARLEGTRKRQMDVAS